MSGDDGGGASSPGKHFADNFIPMWPDQVEPLAGLTVQPASPNNTPGFCGSIFDEALLADLEEEERPCVVSDVVPGSKADLAGLVSGDVLFSAWLIGDDGQLTIGKYMPIKDVTKWTCPDASGAKSFFARRIVHSPLVNIRRNCIDSCDDPTQDGERNLLRRALQEDGFDPDEITERALVPLTTGGLADILTPNERQSQDFFRVKPLVYYCSTGNLKMCKYLLSRGASIHDSKLHPFKAAATARFNGTDICKWLRKEGGKVPDTPADTSPLGIALQSCSEGSLETAKWLILNGGLPLDGDGRPTKDGLTTLFGSPEVQDRDKRGMLSDFMLLLLQRQLSPGYSVQFSRITNELHYTRPDSSQSLHCPLSISCRRHNFLNGRRGRILGWAANVSKQQKLAKSLFMVFLGGTVIFSSTERSSPLQCLGGKEGILSLIADYAFDRGKNTCILRCLDEFRDAQERS